MSNMQAEEKRREPEHRASGPSPVKSNSGPMSKNSLMITPTTIASGPPPSTNTAQQDLMLIKSQKFDGQFEITIIKTMFGTASKNPTQLKDSIWATVFAYVLLLALNKVNHHMIILKAQHWVKKSKDMVQKFENLVEFVFKQLKEKNVKFLEVKIHEVKELPKITMAGAQKKICKHSGPNGIF